MRSMEKFFDFINATELVDLPLTGSKYTWSNNQERVAMTRIDRFLISTEWEEHFAGVIQTALPRGLSNHRPIKLNSEGVNWDRDLSNLRIAGSSRRSSCL